MELNLAFQRRVTKIALAAAADSDFALAGGGALREHGITHRLTQDIDIFRRVGDRERFRTATDSVTTALTEAGYEITQQLADGGNYARLNVTDGDGNAVMIDMGEDYRAHDPVTLDIGPVLSRTDSVAAKVATACTRTYTRDIIDLHYIRASGIHTDRELYELAEGNDPGIDPGMFRDQLGYAYHFAQSEFDEYDVDAAERETIVAQLKDFAESLSQIERERQAPERAPELFAYTMDEQLRYMDRNDSTSSPGTRETGQGPSASPPTAEPGGPEL